MNTSRFPLVLIIGAQKAGTTALFNYLIQHPTIEGSPQKEIHFFNSTARYSRGADFFKAHFSGLPGKIFLDASPSYLASPAAAERIFSYDKSVKMIVILRDPVDRAYSAWNMYQSRYKENRNWFLDGWVASMGRSPTEFIRRRDDELDDFSLFVEHELEVMQRNLDQSIEAPVLMQGLYASHLNRFFRFFPREQLLVLRTEDLRLDTIKILDRIVGFLGLEERDWSAGSLSPVFEGKYSVDISSVISERLSRFYKPYKEQLTALLNENFDWK